jgi:hypothetical protein
VEKERQRRGVQRKQWLASLEFCTFRDLANPRIGCHCGVSGEFWRVSVQSRVVKNEMAISAS